MEQKLDFDYYRQLERDDPEELLRCADQGIPDAAAIIGNGWLIGRFGSVDYEKALHYTLDAAQQNQPMALTNLGQMYLYGYGVPKNEAIAMEHLQKAMNLGFMKAFRYAGLCAAGKAVQYYTSGAECGDITSQFLLGQCYEYGMGVAQDLEMAVHWYRISSQRGDAIAKPAMDALERLGISR